MNNEQFRRLIGANSAKASTSKDGASPGAPTPGRSGTLGSRKQSSIPMTPRAVGGAQADFARQLAERNQVNRARKFKTSTPRGIKLGSGYVDRARVREEEAVDDRAERLAALEELFKKEEIDRATFEKLRFQVAGGDLESTHLVKGLDFKLLQRIRNGEDVYGEKNETAHETEEAEEKSDEENIDDAFDELEDREVQSVAKEKTEKKKGQLSTVALAPGTKRTRDQILAELKASRQAAKAAKESSLGDRFKRIGAKQTPGSRIERDSRGREVLIVIDEDGHEKRKVRKLRPGEKPDVKKEELMPDKDAKPLGMEVPEHYAKLPVPEEDDEDVDIFDGVGDDYDPLAGLAESDSDEASDEEGEAKDDAKPEVPKANAASSSMPPPARPITTTGSHNYFKDSKTGLISEETTKAPSMSDPAIMAAFKRAAALNPIDKEESAKDKEARSLEERRKKLVQMEDRDDIDMDMGFGTSRFEDEEDFEDKKIKLSVWGRDDDDDGESGKGGGSKRKRGAKKRKGDANNAADVLRVMEQRKKAS